MHKTIAIVYNTSHYIYLFRLNLIKKLQEKGFKIVAIAPYDKYSNKLAKEGVSYFDLNIDNKGTNSADILLYVESFEQEYFEETRLSFSTKIVDYFERSKCILAIGDRDSASISYLLENNAAYVITKENEIYQKVEKLVSNKNIINDCALGGFHCGKRNHDLKKIQKGLIKDFESILNSKEQNSSN